MTLRFFRIIPILAFAAFPVCVLADQLTITVYNVKQSEGNVMIAVMASENAFHDKEEPIAAAVIPATTPQVTFTTESLPAGKYGVRVMHDVNDNGRLDANMLGIPKEPYGFSNNARGNFGPPKWPALVFEVSGDTAITINLLH